MGVNTKGKLVMDCKIYWVMDLEIYYKMWRMESVMFWGWMEGRLIGFCYEIMRGNMTWSLIMKLNYMCYKYIVHFHLLKTKLRYIFKVTECVMKDVLPVHIGFLHISESFTRLTTNLFKQFVFFSVIMIIPLFLSWIPSIMCIKNILVYTIQHIIVLQSNIHF